MIIIPIPRIKSEPYVPDINRIKMHSIISKLCDTGYDICTAREAIEIIESKHIDKSQFDFPYGSFDEFKIHVLDGTLEVRLFDDILTPKEKHDALMKAVKEGKSWVTY